MTAETQAAARLPIESPGQAYQRQMLWTVLALWVVVMVGFSIRHLSLALGGH